MFEKINERIEGLKWERDELLERVAKIDRFIGDLVAEKQKKCPHSNSTFTRSDYSPGSYLDREHWDTHTYCKDCNELLSTDTKVGGYG